MSYVKQNWSNGDLITAEKLNHMEDGIETSLPEACQFNADHTVRISWNDIQALIYEALDSGKTYSHGESCPWKKFFEEMNDAEGNGEFIDGRYSKVGEFVYPVTDAGIAYIPYMMWFSPSDNGADVRISIRGYGAYIQTTMSADTDSETDVTTIAVGEPTRDPDAFWPVTQLIIEDNNGGDVQGEI